jgi:putative ABC transport system substrate-binding protein
MGMRRREFLGALGGAAAGWPLAARAQQAMPTIGFLNPASPDTVADRLRAFHRGLKEAGYVEGENVTVLYRWAEGHNNRLPALANDLVQRRVNMIAAFGSVAAPAAKTATTTTPIVFALADDPVGLGLVASLARPGGNLTGINFFSAELVAKRLEILHELLPTASRLAVLVNPAYPDTHTTLRDLEPAARTLGLQIRVANASTSQQIDATFADIARERFDALFLGSDPFFTSRRVQLANLASRYMIPMTAGTREIADAGGLMSYGSNIPEAWRQVGVYAGRVLKGAKPVDTPVIQESKFELVINAQTARMLGLTVPPSLLARADEVIE